jgi:hypothetical protein
LLSEAFNYIGLNSLVLTERADAADVDAVAVTSVGLVGLATLVVPCENNPCAIMQSRFRRY